MPDIRHLVFVKSTPEKIYQAISTQQGIAVYDSNKILHVTTSSLLSELQQAPPTITRTMDKNAGQGEFTRARKTPVYFYAVPLERNGKTAGALLVAFDSSYINSRVLLTLRDALLTADRPPWKVT